MKLQNKPVPEEEVAAPVENINDIFLRIQEENRTVYIDKICDELFIYKPIGRKDWTDIMTDTSISQFEREEIVCAVCTLYPNNYDFKNCVAGIPTTLYRSIVKNSYMTLEDMKNIISMYRDEMELVTNNITCIINEAFPNYDIEEIENWDMEHTLKYFTRAEWKLANLRKIEFQDDILNIIKENIERSKAPDPEEEAKKHDVDSSEINHVKTKITKEKLRELQRKFPEINWTQDSTLDVLE